MHVIVARRARKACSIAAMLLPLVAGCRSKTSAVTSSHATTPAASAPASPPTVLTVPGITLPIPSGYVPMDPSTARQLEGQTAAAVAGAAIVIAGVQAAQGPEEGMLYVTRMTLRKDQLVLRGTIRERFEQSAGALEVMFALSGYHVEKVTSAMGERWVDVRATMTDRVDADARIWTLTRSLLTKDHSLVEVTASCHEHRAAHVCEGSLAKAVLDEPDAAPLDDVLGPPLEPIDMGGFVGGATAAEFFAACEKHGMKRSAWSAKSKPGEEDPEGSLGCEGSVASYAYGPLQMVSTRLHEGKTVSFVYRLDVDPKKAIVDIAARFPTTLMDTKGLRFVHTEAKGDAPMAIGVVPSDLDPKSTYLDIVTRRGFDFSVQFAGE